MRKLAALLFAMMLLAPALALAQDQTATPTPPDATTEATPDATSEATAQPAQIQINPADLPAAATLDRAISDYQASHFEQAVLDSSVYILINPTFAHGYFVRALAYQGLSKLPEALDNLNKALPLAKGDSVELFKIYGARAQNYVDTQQIPEAIADLTSAIKINPTVALYTQRAQLLMQQLNFADAIKDLSEAIKINPTVALYAQRAQLLLEQLKFEDAIKDLNEAIQLAPDNAALLIVRASAYDAMGNSAAAANDYMGWIVAQKPQQINEQPVDPGASLQLDMAADQAYVVPINLKKGQSISIVAVHQSGNIDPLIVLLDTQKQPVASNDNIAPDNGNAMISKFPVPADGVYLLIVSHSIAGTDGQVIVQIRAQ